MIRRFDSFDLETWQGIGVLSVQVLPWRLIEARTGGPWGPHSLTLLVSLKSPSRSEDLLQLQIRATWQIGAIGAVDPKDLNNNIVDVKLTIIDLKRILRE